MTNFTKNAVKESLMDGYLIVNKKLMRQLGGIEVLFLSYLIDKESYWESTGKLVDGCWFFKLSKEIEKDLDIGLVARRKVHKKLMDLGLIEMKRMGTPCKWYYRICWHRLGEFMAEDLPEEQESTYEEDDLEDEGDILIPSEAFKSPLEEHKHASLEEDTQFRETSKQPSMRHKNAPLLPKTEELNLHHPLPPRKRVGEGGEDGWMDRSSGSVGSSYSPTRPTIDQIRRSWERSFLSDSLPAQQDRLPLLRDLMVTLRSHGYSEHDLPRNMVDTVTAHWWSKAKDKKVKESLRERSLKDYDLALADLSDPVEITPAKSMPRNTQKRSKETHEAGSMSLDTFFDLVDQGALEDTDEFYEQMCRLAEQSEREEEAK